MLALPLWVAQNGFLGACGALLICWLFMCATALLLLKANSWFSIGTHFVNTAEGILGPWGKWITWGCYAFIAYASLIAYVAGGAQIIEDLFYCCGASDVVEYLAEVLFTIICIGTLALGSGFLVRCNSLFFAIMMAMFIGILLLGIGHIQPRPFHEYRIEGIWRAFPLFLTAFSFQMIIPSLRTYLKGDLYAVKRSIQIGLGFTLLIYISWMAFVFAIVPHDGPYSLQQALARGEPITRSLIHVITHPALVLLIMLFSLFAIVTSYFGISLGLYEFLEDSLGLRVGRNSSRLLLLSLVAIPSLLCAVAFERIFLVALDLSGGLGDTILNGLIPVAMVAVGYKRFMKREISNLWLKFCLLASGSFAGSLLILELVRLLQGAM